MDRRITTISEPVGILLVQQLSHELYNRNLYYDYAAFFERNGLIKLGKYYRMRGDEELNHYMWIFDRLSEADYPFNHLAILPISEENKPKDDDFAHAFRVTIDKEIETTQQIYHIANVAKEEGDWETVAWLEKLLIPEQHEEESTSRTACEIAELEGSWLIKEKRIVHLLK